MNFPLIERELCDIHINLGIETVVRRRLAYLQGRVLQCVFQILAGKLTTVILLTFPIKMTIDGVGYLKSNEMFYFFPPSNIAVVSKVYGERP